jgi:hypothetical protein
MFSNEDNFFGNDDNNVRYPQIISFVRTEGIAEMDFKPMIILVQSYMIRADGSLFTKKNRIYNTLS